MKKTLLLLALTLLINSTAFAAEAVKTDEQKTLYAVGLFLARQLAPLDLTPGEMETVQQGLLDGFKGKPSDVDINAYGQQVWQLTTDRRLARGRRAAAAGKTYLDKAALEKGAQKSATGMVYLSLKEGEGASPTMTDRVKVRYRGSLPDGSEFDSSYKKNMPTEIGMNVMIACWSEGLQKMKVGGKARLVCPPELAYGEMGKDDLILPEATLVFEVELLDIVKPEEKKPGEKTLGRDK